MDYIIANWANILATVTAVIAAASAIANLTPTETDNKIVAKIAKIINVIALNFKK